MEWGREGRRKGGKLGDSALVVQEKTPLQALGQTSCSSE